MYRLTSILLLSLISISTAWSGPLTGVNLRSAQVENKSPKQALSEQMVKHYPNLAFMLKDPDKFVATMRERFFQQKKKTPETPHQFDYSEIGLPLVKNIREQLVKKTKKVSEEFIDLASSSNANAKEKIRQRREALSFLENLTDEADDYLKKSSISYQNSIEFSFFSSRAFGLFELEKYNIVNERLLQKDRDLHGYVELNVDEQYEAYKKREFSVYQGPTEVEGFVIAEKPFEIAFFNKDFLEVVWVPTDEALDLDIFMRLMTKDIHLVGVLYDVLLADGFYRTSGEFWNHDIRHESVKYSKRKIFIAEQNLSASQLQRLNNKSEKWLLELDQEISELQDEGLKSALALQVFNFHHDRGYPLVPSVYLNYKLDRVPYGLWLMMTVSRQGAGFLNPLNIQKADG